MRKSSDRASKKDRAQARDFATSTTRHQGNNLRIDGNRVQVSRSDLRLRIGRRQLVGKRMPNAANWDIVLAVNAFLEGKKGQHQIN
jgi:hypothetical protein